MHPVAPSHRLAWLAIAAVALLGACSSTSTQVSDEIAKQAKEQLELQDLPAVSCPKNAEAAKDAKFACDLKIGTQTILIDVIFKDDTNFTSEVRGAVYQQKVIDSEISKQLNAESVMVKSFACSTEPVVVIRAGESVTCTATGAEGTTAEVILKLDDNNEAVMAGSLYATDLVEASVRSLLRDEEIELQSIDCGESELLAANEDTTTACKATDTDGATATVTVALGADGTASIDEIVPD
ncbi:MAG: DUF4333 domain-containing protein [Acidimicrobiales bacterium]|nr:DUF4333 domain-containing protein [Acidimicrobiales bacterium]